MTSADAGARLVLRPGAPRTSCAIASLFLQIRRLSDVDSGWFTFPIRVARRSSFSFRAVRRGEMCHYGPNVGKSTFSTDGAIHVASAGESVPVLALSDWNPGRRQEAGISAPGVRARFSHARDRCSAVRSRSFPAAV